MKKRKQSLRRFAGHMETQLMVLAMMLAAAAMFPIFARIRLEARHMAPIVLLKPKVFLRAWVGDWLAGAVVTGLMLLLWLLVMLIFFVMLLWLFGFYASRQERASATNRRPLFGFSPSPEEVAGEQKAKQVQPPPPDTDINRRGGS